MDVTRRLVSSFLFHVTSWLPASTSSSISSFFFFICRVSLPSLSPSLPLVSLKIQSFLLFIFCDAHLGLLLVILVVLFLMPLDVDFLILLFLTPSGVIWMKRREEERKEEQRVCLVSVMSLWSLFCSLSFLFPSSSLPFPFLFPLLLDSTCDVHIVFLFFYYFPTFLLLPVLFLALFSLDSLSIPFALFSFCTQWDTIEKKAIEYMLSKRLKARIQFLQKRRREKRKNRKHEPFSAQASLVKTVLSVSLFLDHSFCSVFPQIQTQRVSGREIHGKSQCSLQVCLCRLLLLHSFVIFIFVILVSHFNLCFSRLQRKGEVWGEERYEETRGMKRRKVWDDVKYCVFRTTDKKSPSKKTSLSSSCERRYNQDRVDGHQQKLWQVLSLHSNHSCCSLHPHDLSSPFILSSWRMRTNEETEYPNTVLDRLYFYLFTRWSCDLWCPWVWTWDHSKECS